jgi:glycosyltransferase
MKISVITTCYNREKTIASAIESTLSQDYANKELVVIDGASKDGSVKIINQYKNELAYFVSEKDSGMYNALNKGIQNCTGDIIGLLHSDDIFYNEKTLSKIAEAFEKTNADIIYANGQYVDEKDIENVKRIYKAKPFKKKYLKYGWIPLHTTIFAKKEVFENYGLYREDFQIASDYEISLRWFSNDLLKKEFLNDWIVKMRLGGKSTSMKQQKKKTDEDIRIIKEYGLLGYFTAFSKIARKIPQYLIPKIFRINS